MQNFTGVSIEPKTAVQTENRLTPSRGSRLLWFTRLSVLILVIGAAAWGIPRHPWYLEWRYANLSINELERERAGRMDDARLLYYLGKKLNEKERFVEADPLLRQAVGLDTNSPRLREEWTRALLGSGLTKAGFGNLREFAGTHPDLAISHIMLGKFYFTQRSMLRAAEEMEAAIKIEPRNATAWSFLASAREALGETQPALTAVEKAVSLNPNSASDHLLMAGLLAQSNRAAEARQEYERAVQISPDWATAQREYARWLLDSGINDADLTQAQKAATRAVASDPNDAGAQLALGRAELRLKRPDAALAPLERAATLAPDDPAGPLSLTLAHEQLGNTAEARTWRETAVTRQKAASEEKMVGEALRAHPEDSALHRKMAKLLGRRGDVDGVVHRHSSALRQALDAPPVMVAAANDLTDGGHADLALPLARRAVQVSGANPAAHEALGNALLGVGQGRQAAVAYSKAAGWWPEKLAGYKKKLATFYDEQNKKSSPAEEAYRQARALEAQQFGPKRITPPVEKLAQQAVALEPANPRYLSYLLQLQMARQRSAEAEKTARQLLAVAPEDGRAHAMLALLLVAKASTPVEYAEVESHLKAAEYDATTAPTRAYVRGEAALRQGEGKAAVAALREAAQRDPNADIIYYKLMLAEKRVGNAKEAAKAQAEFERRQKEKTEESNILGAIAQHPDNPELYDRAVTYYKGRGMMEQANAIRAEANRRFPGTTAANKAATGGGTTP